MSIQRTFPSPFYQGSINSINISFTLIKSEVDKVIICVKLAILFILQITCQIMQILLCVFLNKIRICIVIV